MIGEFTDRYTNSRRLFGQLGLMMFGVLIIYAFGAAQLALVLGTGFEETMTLAVIPFIPIDVIKAAMVAGIGWGVLPKTSYSG